jgi:hypothetical protein
MALPQGIFNVSGAGISAPGGAYAYGPGVVSPNYYAGTFFIDTGYDDPGAWTAGLEAAEIYGARVYGASSFVHWASGSHGAGEYVGKWQIQASAVWSSKFWIAPTGNVTPQQRVFIKVDVWLSEPLDTLAGSYQRLDSVQWTLYRL